MRTTKVNNKTELERLEFVPAERELVFRIREGIDRHLHHRNLADSWHRRHTDTKPGTTHKIGENEDA